MRRHTRSAMTLVEILVGMAIFVSIIMLAGTAFNQFQTVSRRARQAMQIHAKAVKLQDFLSERLGSMLPTAALWYNEQQGSRTLVFLRTDSIGSEHFGNIMQDHERNLDLLPWQAGSGSPGQSDLAWCIIEWLPDGRLRFGQTPRPAYDKDVDYIGRWGYSYNLCGHRRVTVQPHISHLVGLDSASEPGEPRKRGGFHEIWSNATNTIGDFKDTDGDGESADEYRGKWPGKVFGVGFFGNSRKLSNTWAVGNADGRSWNKDWMNLVGDNTNEDYYPDQRQLAFDEIEFLDLTFLDDEGREIESEDDDLGDGSDSLDWYGLAPSGRINDLESSGRPAQVRVDLLVHSVPAFMRDDDDLDGDGDFDERFVDGARSLIDSDPTLSDMAAKRRAFKDLLAKHAQLAESFSWYVELPK